MDYITRIEPVRVVIADPETGLVFGLSQFRHPMKEKSEKIIGVPGVTVRALNYPAFDMPSGHIFKVYGKSTKSKRRVLSGPITQRPAGRSIPIKAANPCFSRARTTVFRIWMARSKIPFEI